MKIRIHDTDFNGLPIDCSGEFFSGLTALDIVEGMKMNPFQSHKAPREVMCEMLSRIGQGEFELPEDPEDAAIVFLQRLTAFGYAHFELDEGELDTQHPIATNPVKDEK